SRGGGAVRAMGARMFGRGDSAGRGWDAQGGTPVHCRVFTRRPVTLPRRRVRAREARAAGSGVRTGGRAPRGPASEGTGKSIIAAVSSPGGNGERSVSGR